MFAICRDGAAGNAWGLELLGMPGGSKFVKTSMHSRHFHDLTFFLSHVEGRGLLKVSRFAHYRHFGSSYSPTFLPSRRIWHALQACGGKTLTRNVEIHHRPPLHLEPCHPSPFPKDCFWGSQLMIKMY